MASRQLLYEPASWAQSGGRMQRSTTGADLQKLGFSKGDTEVDLEKLRATTSPKLGTKDGRKAVKALWTYVSRIAKEGENNPWAKHKLDKQPVRRITHYLWDPDTKSFISHEGLAKMQGKPFDAGAMRECYRMICTEPFGEADHKFHGLNWSKQVPNRALFCRGSKPTLRHPTALERLRIDPTPFFYSKSS